MAAARGPVLAGNNLGYACVMEPHPEQLIEPRDPAAFAKEIVRYLADSKLRSKAVDWQREYVKQYDVAVIGTALVAAYREAIEERRAP